MPVKHRDIFAPLDDFGPPGRGGNPYLESVVSGLPWEGRRVILAGEHLHGMAGKWRTEHFGVAAKTPLYLEIGCHYGQTLCDLAQLEAGVYVGLDITLKRVVRTARRARQAGLRHVACVLGDARQLERIFASGEISGVVCFFPDPWNKKQRQQKHRLLDAHFVQQIAAITEADACFWLRTDVAPYVEEVQRCFEAAGWGVLPAPSDRRLCHRTVTSVFERRFREAGVPIYEKVFVKAASIAVALPSGERVPELPVE